MNDETTIPPRLSRAETKARTRTLLLDAAAREFARRGFAATSVEDIAAAAGFTIGALYSNFAGKEDIFIELLTAQSQNRAAQAAQIATDTGISISARQRALGEVLITVADRDVDVACLEAEFWLYAVRRPPLLEQMSAQVHANRDTIARALGERDKERGQGTDTDLDNLATTLLALFQGMVQLRRTNPELVGEDLYGTAVKWLFTGLMTLAAERSAS